MTSADARSDSKYFMHVYGPVTLQDCRCDVGTFDLYISNSERIETPRVARSLVGKRRHFLLIFFVLSFL